jgi:NADH dehydrogenase [ubiquinone] 1 alpha subcomplex assembly factor 7
VDIFHRPGDCDITANVDFAYLREACSDLVIPHGPITQQDFLMQMGLPLRVSALVRNAASQDRKEAIQTAAERLINPLGMGREYKFLGLTSRKGHVWPFVPRVQEPEQAPS